MYYTFLLRISMPVHEECNIVLPILFVCLSVCLSTAGTVSKMIGHIFTLFDVLVRGIILVFF